MLRADMVEDSRDRSPNAGIETLHRIDVDGVANIFVAGMLHGFMLGKALTNGDEGLRLITHQMRVRLDLCFDRTFGRTQESPVTTAARASPAGVPGVTSVGRCTIAMTGAFSVFA